MSWRLSPSARGKFDINSSMDPDEARQAAAEASRRIREERKLDFGHPVVLRSAAGEVRFEPVSSRHGPTEVRFSVRREATTAGALRLRTPKDPLACAVEKGPDEGETVRAWILAGTGFAELTCLDVADQPVTHPSRRRPMGEAGGSVPGYSPQP